jgi:hypothetical protein
MFLICPLQDPGLGRVYASLSKGVDFLGAKLGNNSKLCVIKLVKREEYYVAGIRGPQSDPRQTLIFDNPSEAEMHANKLRAFGYPKRDICCEQLEVDDEGDAANDSVTNSSDKLDELRKALHRGLPICGMPNNAEVHAIWEDGDANIGLQGGYNLQLSASFEVIDISLYNDKVPTYQTMLESCANFVNLLDELLSLELHSSQPTKLMRLQSQIAEHLKRLTGHEVNRIVAYDKT